MFHFDDAEGTTREAMDAMLKSYSEVAKGFQTIATEANDYSRKSFQDVTVFMEAFVSARSVEAAFELQANYLKSSYEGFIAEATRMSEIYADLAKAVYKPYEAPIAKPANPATTAAA
ncbi:phasin family protein [Rhizobium sp. LC145]|jgi:hypothetical protein|uniref:phasin family protein n=1 Tax=Rhizobium sp. LC145 TaxID=1120688 RepID=UPI00062A0F5C|nr:phasin family protein [Rhizobium sp. LC145]KKX33650.1 phasin family protein [Rhizobium sp. LC145]TKT55388.1 phasin family protein [Rhizobiaceae bacterium LC148]